MKDYAQKYYKDKIADEMNLRTMQQVAGTLALLDFMSFQYFPELLSYVADYDLVKGFKQFISDYNIPHNAEVLTDHFSRNNVLRLARDKWNANGKLGDAYYFAVEAIFNAMSKRVHEANELLSNKIVRDHADVINEVLTILPSKNKEREKEAITNYCTRKNISDEEKNKISDFIFDHYKELNELCNIPGKVVKIRQTAQYTRNLNDFFNDSTQTTQYLNNLKQSRYLHEGRKLYLNPSIIGGLAASISGLFTAAFLAYMLSILSPVIAASAAGPVIWGPIAGLLTVAILILIPLAINKGVSRLVNEYNTKRKISYQDLMFKSKPQYAALIRRYGDDKKSLRKNDADDAAKAGEANPEGGKTSKAKVDVAPFPVFCPEFI